MTSEEILLPGDPTFTDRSVIAGFWRRVGAFLVDSILLGVLTYLVATQFAEQLIELGDAGRLIGLAVSVLYFAIGDSRVAGGQSVGKSFLRVAVVGQDGQGISVARAALRALVLFLPAYLNGFFIPSSGNFALDLAIGLLLVFVVFGLALAAAYLFVFNMLTRQSLHDWLTRTYVVMAVTRGARVTRRTPPIHVAIAALLAFGTIAAAAYLAMNIGKLLDDPIYPRMAEIRDRIDQDPRVAASAVSAGWFATTQREVTQLIVDVKIDRAGVSLRTMLNAVARVVLDMEPELLGRDTLIVTVRRGFDIGVTSSWTTDSDFGSAAEWRQKLEKASGNL